MTKLKRTSFSYLFKSILILLLIFLSGCQSTPVTTIKETEEFYINDRSKILLNATTWTIVTYSEDLYEQTQTKTFKDRSISGSQVVVATYLGEVESFDITKTFNEWGIGDNDMGLLIVLYFSENGDEFIYNDIISYPGLRMEAYLPAITLDGLISDYFDDPSIPSFDYDQRLIAFYFAVLQYLYINVYDYTSFDYQSFIDEYAAVKYDFIALLPSAYEKEPLPIWAIVLIIISVALIGFVPGGYFISAFIGGASGRGRGGGGRGGGYYFRR